MHPRTPDPQRTLNSVPMSVKSSFSSNNYAGTRKARKRRRCCTKARPELSSAVLGTIGGDCGARLVWVGGGREWQKTIFEDRGVPTFEVLARMTAFLTAERLNRQDSS